MWAPILTDEIYDEYLRRAEQAASREVQSLLRFKKHQHNAPTGDDLSEALKKAIAHCRSTLGYQQAEDRRYHLRDNTNNGAVAREVGLGTLACQILLADSKELKRKRKTEPRRTKFSLERGWRSIPPQLRHIVLPFHMLIRSTSILRRAATAQQRGNSIGALMLDATYAYFFQEQDPSFAFNTIAAAWVNAALQSHVEVPSLSYLISPTLPKNGRIDLVALASSATSDVILQAFVDQIRSAGTTYGLSICLSLTIVAKKCKRFPMFWIWENVAAIWMAALDAYERINDETRSVPNGGSSFGHSAEAIARKIDQSLVDIAETCEDDMLKTDHYRPHPWFYNPPCEDEHEFMFQAMIPVFKRLTNTVLHNKLPLATKCAARWLIEILDFFRTRPYPVLRSEDMHSCYFVMTGDARSRHCAEYDHKTDADTMRARCALERVSDQDSGPNCRIASELIAQLTQKLRYQEESSASQAAKALATGSMRHQKSDRLFNLEDLRKPPFSCRTVCIMRCIAVLSEHGLHRVEAGLAAALLEAWNYQTEHGDPKASSESEDYWKLQSIRAALVFHDQDEEYDCEVPEHRSKRRALVADMIAERVTRAEGRAIAQETKLRKAEQNKTEDGTKEKSSNRWRYEPLLDQWVEKLDPKPSSDEERKPSLRNAVTPRPSSPDPLLQTSPFGAEHRRADDDHDGASDADSYTSNLKRKSGSNPYTTIIESSGQDRAAMPESEQDEMDLFQRRTPAAKRQRRAPQRYTSQEWDSTSKGKGKGRQM